MFACTDGHIWSIRTGTLIKRIPRLNTSNYYHLNIPMGNGKRKTIAVHTLVLLAFYGDKPPSFEARHLNGNKHDNRPDNLCWGARQENDFDKVLHGADGRKFNPLTIKMIRASKGKVSAYFMAKTFGVSQRTIGDILHYRSYKHI